MPFVAPRLTCIAPFHSNSAAEFAAQPTPPGVPAAPYGHPAFPPTAPHAPPGFAGYPHVRPGAPYGAPMHVGGPHGGMMPPGAAFGGPAGGGHAGYGAGAPFGGAPRPPYGTVYGMPPPQFAAQQGAAGVRCVACLVFVSVWVDPPLFFSSSTRFTFFGRISLGLPCRGVVPRVGVFVRRGCLGHGPPPSLFFPPQAAIRRCRAAAPAAAAAPTTTPPRRAGVPPGAARPGVAGHGHGRGRPPAR